MRDVTSRRPTSLHPHSAPRSAPLLVLLVVTALVATCGSPAPTGTPPPTPVAGDTVRPSSPTADGTPTRPGANPATSANPAPSGNPQPTAWTAVTPAGLPRVATLEPTTSGRAGVAPNTSFRLTSLDGRSPAVLASHLVADPPLSFTVASVSGTTALIRPTAPLQPQTSYRISLARADGSIEASWAALAAGPLQVTDTVPGDQSTQVPLDTGIELTFDQYGVKIADLSSHFTIRPAADGRFEVADRAIVFVPAKPLKKGTLYTVTVKRGLPLAGTGQVLDQDHVVQFETAAKAPSKVNVSFRLVLTDATPREKPVLVVSAEGEGDSWTPPSSIPITVHRIPGVKDAIAAYGAIGGEPDWTRVTSAPAVSTRGLTRVYAGSVRLRHEPEQGWYWVQVPQLLPAGWYVVTERFAGIDRQALLQVSDLATFVLATTDRTAVWVNDLRTAGPAAGASIAVDDRPLGSTDTNGLLIAKTPATVADPGDDAAEPLLVVRQGSRAHLLPVANSPGSGYCPSCVGSPGDTEWWRVFRTDRAIYRATDTVNAWGAVRSRDTGAVPPRVTVSLYADSGEDDVPAIARTIALPDRNGAFKTTLPIRDLPLGDYRVRLEAGDATLGDLWISVDVIVKPAYRLTVVTDKPAVLAGAPVKVSADATFYEGTPVAGTGLAFRAENTEKSANATTDALGRASTTLTLAPNEDSQWDFVSVGVNPRLPEEGDISGSTSVAVFRGSALLDIEAGKSQTQVTVTGKVSNVNLGAFDSQTVDASAVDPRGAPRRGAVVKIKVDETLDVGRQVGTTYDFILKKVVPRYEWEYRSRVLGTRTVSTGTGGTFRIALPISAADRAYEVTATYTDEGGHLLTATTWAGDEQADEGGHGATLANADPSMKENIYSVGQAVRVTFDGGPAHPKLDRYLFAVTQEGLQSVSIGTSPTYRTTFSRESLPSVGIEGVRFNGSGYEMAIGTFTAGLRIDDRRITVALTPDKQRYEPGGTAVVGVRTLGPDGSPLAATVLVNATDAKLEAIETARNGEGSSEQEGQDPLAELYAELGSGIIGYMASHRTAEDVREWGGGDTGGGDGDTRNDFRDWLVAELVTTGADGRASVRVPLADDLTSWRVSGTAITSSLQAGTGETMLPVGLDFFVEAALAPEYLASDRPVIRVRSFGSGLANAQPVTFTVSSDTLGMAPVVRQAAAFEAAEVPLPSLSVGTHRVRIEGRTGSGSSARTDTLVRTFQVVGTRATQSRTTWSPLAAATGIKAGPDMTRLVLVDAGRGRVVPLLQELSSLDGARADWELAKALAARVLDESFGLTADTTVDLAGMDPFAVKSGDNSEPNGLAIVRWGSPQLEVTALAAMAGDPRVDGYQLSSLLQATYDNTKNTLERRLLAMAGLAALGEPLLVQVRDAAGHPDMTVPEEVNLALAALFAGDETLAGRLEQHVLAQHGQRRGALVRIDPADASDANLLTARLAIVAASLGDPVAAGMDAWVAENPPPTTAVDLERALAARGWARRAPGAEAAAAVTVDGSRRTVRVLPGQPATIPLTPAQAASAKLEPVSGSVLVVQTWRAPLEASSLRPLAGQGLERIVQPAGTIGMTSTVVVRLRVTLGTDAGNDCWTVTDLLPSGLAPIVGQPWLSEDGVNTWNQSYPDRANGQRVEFCVSRNPKLPVQELRYLARVVSPGSYTWEPAVLQSDAMPDRGVVMKPGTVRIAGANG